jgi:Caspase recruitment domain
MMSNSCLTYKQLTDLQQENKPRVRNKKLLEMLKRRGICHFKEFIACLEKTQPHMTSLLTGDTGSLSSDNLLFFLYCQGVCAP